MSDAKHYTYGGFTLKSPPKEKPVKLTRYKHKPARQELTPDQKLARAVRGTPRPSSIQWNAEKHRIIDEGERAQAELDLGTGIGMVLRIILVWPFLIPWRILKTAYKVLAFFVEHAAALMYLSIYAVILYIVGLVVFLTLQ